MVGKYTPNHRATRKYLQFDPSLRRELHRRALLGLGVAVALAPRRTGRLAASGDVRDNGPLGGEHHDRMSFSIVFDVPYAVPVTFPKGEPTADDYLDTAVIAMDRGR